MRLSTKDSLMHYIYGTSWNFRSSRKITMMQLLLPHQCVFALSTSRLSLGDGVSLVWVFGWAMKIWALDKHISATERLDNRYSWRECERLGACWFFPRALKLSYHICLWYWDHSTRLLRRRSVVRNEKIWTVIFTYFKTPTTSTARASRINHHATRA